MSYNLMRNQLQVLLYVCECMCVSCVCVCIYVCMCKCAVYTCTICMYMCCMYVHVIVVTQARVRCLICTHDARGRAAPEGECGHIRQRTSACVITNMLHFRHSKNLPKLDSNISASLYSNGYLL